MTNYRVVKTWDNHTASYYYELEQFYPYETDHSCYGCFDDWNWQRRKCSQNKDRWEPISSGNKKWSIAIMKHYKIDKLMEKM